PTPAPRPPPRRPGSGGDVGPGPRAGPAGARPAPAPVCAGVLSWKPRTLLPDTSVSDHGGRTTWSCAGPDLCPPTMAITAGGHPAPVRRRSGGWARYAIDPPECTGIPGEAGE